jgi:hypothetical protein
MDYYTASTNVRIIRKCTVFNYDTMTLFVCVSYSQFWTHST